MQLAFLVPAGIDLGNGVYRSRQYPAQLARQFQCIDFLRIGVVDGLFLATDQKYCSANILELDRTSAIFPFIFRNAFIMKFVSTPAIDHIFYLLEWPSLCTFKITLFWR